MARFVVMVVMVVIVDEPVVGDGPVVEAVFLRKTTKAKKGKEQRLYERLTDRRTHTIVW